METNETRTIRTEEELRNTDVCFTYAFDGVMTHIYYNGLTSMEIIGMKEVQFIAAGNVKVGDVIRIAGYTTTIRNVRRAPMMPESDYMVNIKAGRIFNWSDGMIKADAIVELTVPGDTTYKTEFENALGVCNFHYGTKFIDSDGTMYHVVDIKKLYDTKPGDTALAAASDDDDDDIAVPDGTPCPEAKPITHDDAICVNDDEDEEEGEPENPQTPDPNPAEEESEDSEDGDLSDDEFWKRVQQIDEESDKLKAEQTKEKVKNLKDVLAFAELKPNTARCAFKRMANLCEDMEIAFNKLARHIKKSKKLNVNDPIYRQVINLSGQLRFLMAMVHIDGDALLTADCLSLYDAGVATSSAKINLWEAETVNSALINKEVK